MSKEHKAQTSEPKESEGGFRRLRSPPLTSTEWCVGSSCGQPLCHRRSFPCGLVRRVRTSRNVIEEERLLGCSCIQAP